MLMLIKFTELPHIAEMHTYIQKELASASLALDAARAEDAARKRSAADQDSTVSRLEAELAGLQAAAHEQADAVRR